MHIRRFTVDWGAQWKTSLSVVVGAYDITHVDDRWSRRHQVREVVIHELFEHVTYHNDIALLRVSPAVEFNDKIGPICVDSSALPADPECFVTGWGDTNGSGRLYTAVTFIFAVLLEYQSFYTPSVNPSQTLARGPSPSAEEYPAPFC